MAHCVWGNNPLKKDRMNNKVHTYFGKSTKIGDTYKCRNYKNIKNQKLKNVKVNFPKGQIRNFELYGDWFDCRNKKVMGFYKTMPYKQFLTTRYWRIVREDILNVKKICELCGSCQLLQVHHKTYKIRGREMHDESQQYLQLLCQKCHYKLHDKAISKKLDRTNKKVRQSLDLAWKDLVNRPIVLKYT